MNLSSYRLESNELFLNGYVTRVICKSFIHRKESDNKKEKENTQKDNFQGKSSKSTCLFNLDREWLEKQFRPREPDLYRKLNQTKFRGDYTKHFKYLEYQLVMQK